MTKRSPEYYVLFAVGLALIGLGLWRTPADGISNLSAFAPILTGIVVISLLHLTPPQNKDGGRGGRGGDGGHGGDGGDGQDGGGQGPSEEAGDGGPPLKVVG